MCENKDALIDRVKAHFTLTTELASIEKKSQMLPPAGRSEKIIFTSVSGFFL